MKKIINILMVFLAMVSCINTGVFDSNEPKGGGIPRPQCYIYYVDGFKEKLEISIRDYQYPMLLISWETNNDYSDFRIKDASIEQRIIQDLGKNGFVLLDDLATSIVRGCYSGVSGPLRIYSDEVIDNRPAGDNLSDFFFVLSDINPLAYVEYPSLTFVKNWCMGGETISSDTYFSKKAVPFITARENYRSCDLSLVTAENKQYILDGTHNLFFELPLIGTKSDGSEISMVLKGSFLRP